MQIKLIPALLLLAVCAYATRSLVTSDLPPNFPEEELFNSPFHMESCVSSDLFRRAISYMPGSKELSVITHERTEPAEDFTTSVEPYSTPFTLLSIASREGGDSSSVKNS